MTGPLLVPSDGLPWLGQVPLPDCRTCRSFSRYPGNGQRCLAADAGVQCFRGSRYKPLEPIALWARS